jgi:hypothetical protein
LGICPKRSMVSRVLKELKEQAFLSVVAQYEAIPAYCSLLQARKHKAIWEADDQGRFFRCAVAFWEGLQAAREYRALGLQLDGTHLRTLAKGVLLVACLQDANGGIMVVAVAAVAGEDHSNWSWLTSFLSLHLDAPPVLVVSDRDKGLLRAVEETWQDSHHFFCFRHLCDNLNKAHKDPRAKELAWEVAKANSITHATSPASAPIAWTRP